MRNSGKLLIVGIVTLAVLLAGAGWWFRYRATHRAAQFWGPEAARLIRDAPEIYLIVGPSAGATMGVQSVQDVSTARGITHLRNALLEDRSFNWPNGRAVPIDNDFADHWALEFKDSTKGERLTILFSTDCQRAAHLGDGEQDARLISCKPIASGLREMFGELSAGSTSPPR